MFLPTSDSIWHVRSQLISLIVRGWWYKYCRIWQSTSRCPTSIPLITKTKTTNNYKFSTLKKRVKLTHRRPRESHNDTRGRVLVETIAREDWLADEILEIVRHHCDLLHFFVDDFQGGLAINLAEKDQHDAEAWSVRWGNYQILPKAPKFAQMAAIAYYFDCLPATGHFFKEKNKMATTLVQSCRIWDFIWFLDRESDSGFIFTIWF